MKFERLNLNGEWTLQYGPQRERAARMNTPEIPAEWKSIPAQVPGNVELDLIRAGELPADLDRGNNIYRLRQLENHQWWYSRTFAAPRLQAGERCELVLEGVDTLASVWLNGVRIGTPENMLIPHRLDITEQLRAGENLLVAGIDSTVLAAREHPVNPGELAMENNWESLRIRKAAHGFGWDIMPRAVSAGLWRGVHLEIIPETRFRMVYTTTMSVDVEKRSAWFWLSWDIGSPQWPVDDWTVRMTLSSADGRSVVMQKSAIGAGATPPVLTYADGFPEIIWEEGPYEWTYLFPYGGTDAEFGFSVVEVEIPEGVFVEAQTTYSVGIFPA